MGKIFSLKRLALLVLVLGTISVWGMASYSSGKKDTALKSHLTIYVGEDLLNNGGTVIVGSVPIPEAEWRALEGLNLADDDTSNAKRAHLAKHDQLFGVQIFGPVSYIEMYYPEGGTFGFNLVPDYRLSTPKRLVTERILVGDGGWYDRTNDRRHDWPDVSVIHLSGPAATKANSRLVRALGNNILNLNPDMRRFKGAIVYTPTDQQLKEGTWGEYQ
ncbi:hypothetical protein [Nereida sp. MMG025]|uniref:hypothetical protein n=1 Tax=Nereida sp. MMG025 TaxID=2909981 RepID=UPI001F48BBBA|nr:hypothetical protein [Nereida sp. MMG025]MCF6446123.1 hypothetical protein [Nereida sp. MMG025]